MDLLRDGFAEGTDANADLRFQDKSPITQRLLIRISVSDFRTVPSGCWSRRAQPTLLLFGFAQKVSVEHVALEEAVFGPDRN